MRHRWPHALFLALWLSLWLAGCTKAGLSTLAPTSILLANQPTLSATAIPRQIMTQTPSPSAAPGPTQAPATPTPPFAICSPLEGITLAEMAQPDLLKNPFQPPRPGFDDGHFGADFAYWSRGARKTMLGLPVYSMFNGRVAGVIYNREPYGNAIIIETNLRDLPASWLPAFPTPAPTISPASSLYCPPDLTHYITQPGQSLYLLYAHFNQAPEAALNQTVSCGQEIGAVGTTGKSVNPHLHLETRLGPAGVTFPEMAHYDNAATNSEMSTYCTWRVTGLFQAFDPLKILSLQP